MKTSVEWLIERLMDGQVDNKMLATAKELEKQQIIEAYRISTIESSTPREFKKYNSPEQYYNETFKK